MKNIHITMLVKQTLSICLVLNIFLVRPSALGQSFSPIGITIAPILLMVHLWVTQGKRSVINKELCADVVGAIYIFGLYWIYLLPVSLFWGGDEITILKDLLSSGIILFCYGCILVNVQSNIAFFEKFSTTVALIGWSSCITIVLGLMVGFENIFITSINVKGYADGNEAELGTGAIYFPFSMLYSKFSSGDVELMRFNGFFREAGIYQGVACFLLFYEAFTRRSWWRMAGLIGGTVAAFSSIGIVLLLLTLAAILLKYVRSKFNRIILVFAVFISAYPVAVYTPYIGLDAKMDTHSASISDRTTAVSNGMNAVMQNPLGTGLYAHAEANDAITLIAAVGNIGVIGVLLQAIILSGWRGSVRSNSKARILICTPLLLTGLLSQPIAGAPMMYVLPMLFIQVPTRRAAHYKESRTSESRPTLIAMHSSASKF